MDPDKQSEEPLIPVSSDECGHSGGEPDSDEDVITNYHIPTLDMLPRPGPLPTISVTPHSPASKIYPVLEDSLQQVRELHESVQHMRNVAGSNSYGTNSRDFVFTLNPLLAEMARLSSSCPVLNETGLEPDVLGGSLGSSPLHQPPSRKGSGTQDWLCQPEPQRRRSWTALEDLSGKDMKHKRQRSISLSSMESEADESSLVDNVDGSTARLLGPDAPILVRHRGTRGTGGAASTHSLNEADLQNDFNKIKAKREAEQLRLLPQRLPLQKSISTPSIIAVRDLAPEPALAGGQPTLPILMSRGRPSGTESETEEEGNRSGQVRYAHSAAHLQYVPYDRHAEKRRKRGSLFFRKKKDKSKKVPHQWVSACYGSSQICDVCKKPISNKQALYCECCGSTVHANLCSENIADCKLPKGSKANNKISVTGFSVPLTNSKSSLSKRGSGSLSNNHNSSSNRRSQLCYSPWRRVANKLGVNQILYDKDTDHGHHDGANFADDVPLVPMEFLSDSPLTAADLCSDFSLGLHESEPDSWTPAVGKEIARRLKEKEVKRQEHIYEFILTEKHHCMTLLVMQKVFVDGLQKYFQLGDHLGQMFPKLMDLTEIHLGLLSRLRQRQREGPVVSTIADIILDQFSNDHAIQLKSSYGEFCSQHREAVELYKQYLQTDVRFGQFVRHCQTNPLLKKKGIPECILFVTQRLTKYPLLIEPLIKTSRENKEEQETLQKSLALVKDILIEVNAKVAEKEKKTRQLEIYSRLDAKSYTLYKDHKFKKSDIMHGNRTLKFEGEATIMQPGRAKMQSVFVVVLSDVLFFMVENSNKYSFFPPNNKVAVISLQKLILREKGEKVGQDSRGIYLISSNPAEMYELKVQKPKDKQVWIQAIQEAVASCPADDEDNIALTSEDKLNQIRDFVGLLRQKDVEQALLLEEKMVLHLKLLTAAGIDPPSSPSYRHLVSENVDITQMWGEVISAVKEVSHFASSLYTTGTNLSRSVSSAGEHQSETYVPPIIPKRAETFGGFDASSQGSLKLLGKKIHSSGGTPVGTPDLETLKPGDSRILERLPFRNCVISGPPQTNGNTEQSQHLTALPDAPALFSLGREQQYAAVQVSHYLYTLICIICQLMTTNDSHQATINTLRGGSEGSKHYRHNQQLEELRNLQDKLTIEKASWAATREQEEKDLEEKKAELLKLQEQVRSEQNDIDHQREQLYRYMEYLTNQGLMISPNFPVLPVTSPVDDSSKDSSEADSSPQSDSSATTNLLSSGSSASHTSTTERRKDSKYGKGPQTSKNLPPNLISTTNEQKISQGTLVKQQIPYKLESLGSSQVNTATASGPKQMLPSKLRQEEKNKRRSTGTSGYQRLGSDSFSPPSGETTPTMVHSHSRTGSSPALMQASPPSASTNQSSEQGGGPKAARTHTYPKIPDKFKQSPADEKVMYV